MQRKFAVGTIDKLAGSKYTNSVSTAMSTPVMDFGGRVLFRARFLHGFSVNFHWIRVVVIALCSLYHEPRKVIFVQFPINLHQL